MFFFWKAVKRAREDRREALVDWPLKAKPGGRQPRTSWASTFIHTFFQLPSCCQSKLVQIFFRPIFMSHYIGDSFKPWNESVFPSPQPSDIWVGLSFRHTSLIIDPQPSVSTIFHPPLSLCLVKFYHFSSNRLFHSTVKGPKFIEKAKENLLTGGEIKTHILFPLLLHLRS